MTFNLFKCERKDCGLKQLVNTLDEIVVLQKSSGEYIYLNKLAKSLLKRYMKEDDYIGKKPDDIFSDRDANNIYNQLNEVIKTKKKIEVENWFTLNTNNFCFRETIFPLLNNDENPEVVAKIGKDITTQRMMGESLKESEIKFLKLIENLPCGILIIQDEKIKIINSGFSKITGYPQSNFKTLDDVIRIITPQYKQLIFQNYQKRISDKDAPSVYTVEIITSSDEKRILKIFATKVIFNNEPASMAAFFDITVMKKMQSELNEQNNKLVKIVDEKTKSLKKSKENYKKTNRYLKDLINSSNDVIIAFDELKNLIIWNTTVENLTGIKENQIRGKNLSKLDIFDSKQKIQDCLNQSENNKKSKLIIRTDAGERRIFLCTCNRIEHTNGEYAGLLLVGKDITETKKMISQLIPGQSYLITPELNNLFKQIIRNLVNSGYSIFTVTRGKFSIDFKSTERKCVCYEWNEERKSENSIDSVNDLYYKLLNYLNTNKRSIIYLNRLDYLLINENFNEIMKFFFKINNLLRKTSSFLFLDIDPLLLTEKELTYLKMEFYDLPRQPYISCNLLPDEMKILEYIKNMNQKNILVSYKDIGKKFSMVSQTTSNKLKQLENKGVINIVKNGKRKNLFVSKKGEIILSE